MNVPCGHTVKSTGDLRTGSGWIWLRLRESGCTIGRAENSMFSDKTTFKEEYTEKIVSTYGRSVEETSAIERYLALGEMIRAYATENWYRTQMALREQQTKMVYYFSLEFLIGRSLENNLKSLGLYDMVRDGLKELKVDYEDLKEAEAEPGLGNGGLGRLAA
ncbi:MAG: glycogen/starch/alpha-glucan phosphorylase, partial [Erysipelotrichaceae bacterium]|nr:glycogen/starch/alpha-glucan phosphorylase [Erysipelotrichaceae bacterium]